VLRLRPTASARDGRDFDLGVDVARHCQLLSDERRDRVCTGFDGPPQQPSSAPRQRQPPPSSARRGSGGGGGVVAPPPEARCVVDTMVWRTSALRPPKCTAHAPRHAHDVRPGLAAQRWVERLLRMRWPTP